MTPEAREHFSKAHELLKDSHELLAIKMANAAGHWIYLAAYHAAQGYIHSCTGRIAKTHNGTKTVFGQLAKDEPGIPKEFLVILPNTYNMKAIADYETGPTARTTMETATAAFNTVTRFITYIEKLAESK